jgi:hypothetical protein
MHNLYTVNQLHSAKCCRTESAYRHQLWPAVILFGGGSVSICDCTFSSTDCNFQNQTRGLFGNWSHDIIDDFTLPNGLMAGASTTINNFESIHKDFALQCKYTKP